MTDRVDRYEVEKVLGEGGMGRVVLAKDPLLGRRLAVKTLLSQASTASLRFAEEAQITGQLDHPNIIPVHAFGQDDGVPWLAMRLVAGRDLKALIGKLQKNDKATRSAYGLRRLLRLSLKICGAVGHAHARGVIHRDLKPANVMLGEDDEVLVMDWGLAKPMKSQSSGRDGPAATGAAGGSTPSLVPRSRTSGERSEPHTAPQAKVDAKARLAQVESLARAGGADLTQEGAIVGTPIYMAPEQAADGTISDPRADVYALGALLYELLTLKQPYEGSSLEVITALITGKPQPKTPRLAAPRADIPAPVEAIVQKAMARSADARYPDAAALAADIEAFLDERPISCYRETAREAASRLASRHRLPLIAAGVAAAALTITGVTARAVTVGQARDAERAATTSEALAEQAAKAAKAAEASAAHARLLLEAEALASQAARRAAELGRAARTVCKVDLLREQRDATVAELDRLVTAAGRLGEDAAAKAAIEHAVDRVHLAREAADLAFARALVNRQPWRAVDQLAALAPGPEAALLHARALVLAERGPEAAAALATARWPADRPDLAAAARVVGLMAADAPTGELMKATQAALEAAPGTAWLVGLRARLRARDGERDAAALDYERALSLDPTDLETTEQRTFDLYPVNMMLEHFSAGLVHYALAIADDPAEAQRIHRAHHHDWTVHMWTYGWYDRRVPEITGLVKEGRMPRLHGALHLAEMALMVGQHADAERYGREALAAAPGDRRALGLLAEALAEQKKTDEARQVADEGLKRHPTDGQLAYARGLVAFAEGQLEDAARWLELGARRSILPVRWARLAACYLEMTDARAWEKGVEAMREGLRYDVWDCWLASHAAKPLTGDPRYHRLLGDLRRKQGNLAAAALHYRRAMAILQTPDERLRGRLNELFQGDQTDAMRLGEVHEAMGLFGEAHHFYGQARQDPKLAAEATKRLERLTGRRQ